MAASTRASRAAVGSAAGANVVRYPRSCDLCDGTVKADRFNVCDPTTTKTLVDTTSLNGEPCRVQIRIGTGRKHAQWVESDSICFRCLRRAALEAIDVLESYYHTAASRAA